MNVADAETMKRKHAASKCRVEGERVMKEEIKVVDLLKADKITLIVESGEWKTTFKTEAMLGLFNHIEKTLKAEQQAHNALKENLKTIEWACDNSQMCPVCFGTRIRNTSFIGGHREDCWLDKTINND